MNIYLHSHASYVVIVIRIYKSEDVIVYLNEGKPSYPHNPISVVC